MDTNPQSKDDFRPNGRVPAGVITVGAASHMSVTLCVELEGKNAPLEEPDSYITSCQEQFSYWEEIVCISLLKADV